MFQNLLKRKKIIKKKVFWKDLLLELYNSKSNWSYYGRGNKHYHIEQGHPLCKTLKCSAKDLDSSLDFLKAHKLIEEQKELNYQFNLTDKGFEVAMQIEKDKISKRNDFMNLKLVASLLIISLIQVVLNLLEFENKKIISTGVYFGFLIIILYFFSKLFLSLEK